MLGNASEVALSVLWDASHFFAQATDTQISTKIYSSNCEVTYMYHYYILVKHDSHTEFTYRRTKHFNRSIIYEPIPKKSSGNCSWMRYNSWWRGYSSISSVFVLGNCSCLPVHLAAAPSPARTGSSSHGPKGAPPGHGLLAMAPDSMPPGRGLLHADPTARLLDAAWAMATAMA